MKLTKEHLKTPAATAVISAFVYGIVTHSFALNNLLQNHDNIASQPGGYGAGVALGRWLLELLGLFFDKIGLNYNLSVVNGLAYIVLIALAAGLLVLVLRIRKRGSAALIGMLLVAFPTVTATMVYRYTAPFYGISLVCAILAVWVLQNRKWGFVPSALLVTCSMGIYQAYVPLTIGLFVLLLIRQALEEGDDIKKLILRGLYDCGALILGLALYFVGQTACQNFFGVALTEYQGVSSMGNLTLDRLPALIWQAFYTVCALPLQDFCGVANRALMRIAYLLLSVLSIGMVIWILLRKKKGILSWVAVLLLCVLFPVAVGFILVMCPDGWVYSLMVHSFALLGCAPLVLLECLPEQERPLWKRCIDALKKGTLLLVVLLVVYYGYYANVNYTALYYANRQIENYLNSVVVQVRMTEGFTPEKQWAVLGDIDDPLFGSPWEEDAIYGGLGFTQYLLNQYSRNDWIENYIGYEVPQVSDEKLAELKNSEEVQAMPCYPSEGSIKVIGETVVIKFQELDS